MGRVIPLPGDPHQRVQALLPWYVNGTLDACETAAVEAHLADCAECRADLSFERTIGRDIEDVPLDVERGWAAMRSRIDPAIAAPDPEAPAANVVPLPLPFWRRRVPLGWAMAAQAAALLVVAGGARLLVPPAMAPAPAYHALGSTPQGAPGNMIVIFRPDTPEQDLRGAMTGNGAELVGGPTAAGAYVLRIAAPRRDAALTRLRADSHVVMAQPIDTDAAP